MQEHNATYSQCYSASRDAVITSVVPGDYDGDSQMDVLLTSSQTNSDTTVFVFWGNNQTLGMPPA